MMVFMFPIHARWSHSLHLNISMLPTVIQDAHTPLNQMTAAEGTAFRFVHAEKTIITWQVHGLSHSTIEIVQFSPIKNEILVQMTV